MGVVADWQNGNLEKNVLNAVRCTHFAILATHYREKEPVTLWRPTRLPDFGFLSNTNLSYEEHTHGHLYGNYRSVFAHVSELEGRVVFSALCSHLQVV